ncbi:MAG: Fluoroacetate dehalogenase [Alphaproteobacteria bacterium MarineAlpha9_Bin5]|nr:MAG: Fluoroacetate dehalogenase [Alphaproteobacteria bacterium MarineAlpha9_Bin6]PPR40056.1 MAG: Fluoroacetate dehalogenase [Alphaproteobacteria bacterium MarineAlpha9_Bin5]
MFSSFIKEKIKVSGTDINLVRGGEGPPLLLLHGYPQSHVMWHKVAPKLAKQFTLVISDLRGYGDSGKPPSDDDHFNYSKRATARDQVEVMSKLGHDHFMVAGHDRGARVGHRMAIDYSDKVNKLCVLDIVPTYRVFADANKQLATMYWHWFFLIQKAPLPETLIGNNVEFYLRTQFRSWGNSSDYVTEEAFTEYYRCLQNAETIRATCEDYRAGASIDLEHDKADMDQKLSCPLLVLWGELGAMHKLYDVTETWRERAADVNGWPVKCGHFIPEEAPEATINAFSEFFGE